MKCMTKRSGWSTPFQIVSSKRWPMIWASQHWTRTATPSPPPMAASCRPIYRPLCRPAARATGDHPRPQRHQRQPARATERTRFPLRRPGGKPGRPRRERSDPGICGWRAHLDIARKRGHDPRGAPDLNEPAPPSRPDSQDEGAEFSQLSNAGLIFARNSGGKAGIPQAAEVKQEGAIGWHQRDADVIREILGHRGNRPATGCSRFAR